MAAPPPKLYWLQSVIDFGILKDIPIIWFVSERARPTGYYDDLIADYRALVKEAATGDSDAGGVMGVLEEVVEELFTEDEAAQFQAALNTHFGIAVVMEEVAMPITQERVPIDGLDEKEGIGYMWPSFETEAWKLPFEVVGFFDINDAGGGLFETYDDFQEIQHDRVTLITAASILAGIRFLQAAQTFGLSQEMQPEEMQDLIATLYGEHGFRVYEEGLQEMLEEIEGMPGNFEIEDDEEDDASDG